MKDVVIAAARRTAVCPKGGAFVQLDVGDLMTPVIKVLLSDANIREAEIDQVIVGNALYGGGNPARVAALQAGLPAATPAMTIDTQCCSGLDAVNMAFSRIKAGEADIILAGGAESYSRAPIRMRRPKVAGEKPKAYSRPPFTPWADRDPDLISAAADLAATDAVLRDRQEQYAIESHKKAVVARDRQAGEIVLLNSVLHDPFTRKLTKRLCKKLPSLGGANSCDLTASTIAVKADAAAMLVICSVDKARDLDILSSAIRIVDYNEAGCDPDIPMKGLQIATDTLLKKRSLSASSLNVVEAMEAFAVQMIDFLNRTGIDPAILNRGGGALARGHPIGASGAINLVRLWHELQSEKEGSLGLACIAAAGGLGSAILLER